MEIIMDNTNNSNSDEDQRNIHFDVSSIPGDDENTQSSTTSMVNETKDSKTLNLKRKCNISNTLFRSDESMNLVKNSQQNSEMENHCVSLRNSQNVSTGLEEMNLETNKRRRLSEKDTCTSHYTYHADGKKIAVINRGIDEMKDTDSDHVKESISNTNYADDIDIEAISDHLKEVLNKLPIFLQMQAKLELFQTLNKYKNLNEQMFSNKSHNDSYMDMKATKINENENLDMDTNSGSDNSLKFKNEMLVPD